MHGLEIIPWAAVPATDETDIERACQHQQQHPIGLADADGRPIGGGRRRLLARLKLPHGLHDPATGAIVRPEQAGERHAFHPLTPDEAVYPGTGPIDGPDLHGADELCAGGVVLYRDGKWLALRLVYRFDEAGDRRSAWDRAVAAGIGLLPRVRRAGGHIILYTDVDKRHELTILLPFGFAEQQARDHGGWKRFLCTWLSGEREGDE